jgi:hypothetical protein
MTHSKFRRGKMKKSFFVMCFMHLVFFAICSASTVVKASEIAPSEFEQEEAIISESDSNYLLGIIFKTSKDEVLERFNTEVAKYLSRFQCPDLRKIESKEMQLIYSAIFNDKDGEKRWVEEMNTLVLNLTDGSVHVSVGEDVHLRAYLGKRLYIKVFSAGRSAQYFIVEGEDSIACLEGNIEVYVNWSTGG